MASETSGVLGPRSLKFVEDLGAWLRQVTGEENSKAVTVPRGNVASVMGSVGLTESDVLIIHSLHGPSESR